MTASGDRRRVVVVGGGHNGLVAAFYLARAGLQVTVLERRPFVGGACVTEELFPGYRVSSCSFVAWLLQPKVIADMQLARHGFRYRRLDPWRTSLWPDRDHLLHWHEAARTQAGIERFNRYDAEAYPAFKAYWKRIADVFYHFFLRDPPTLDQVRAQAAAVGEEALLERFQSASIAEICEEYFQDQRLQAAVVKVGETGDPWKSGSAWSETYFSFTTDLGQALVTGGNGAITQAMAMAVQDAGGFIRTGAEVEQILVSDGQVHGVQLSSGESLPADLVVSNADPKRTYLTLLDRGDLAPDFRHRVEGLSTKAAYLKFHAVLDVLPDLSSYLGRPADPRELGYMHIAPSLDTFRQAFGQAQRGEPATKPVVHIQIPTVYDATLTERDGHIASVWVMYAPRHLAQGTWEERRHAIGEQLIDYVTEYIPNFRRALREWVLFTPLDMEQRIGLTDGNIRHLDTIPSQYLWNRPLPGAGYRTPIEGLYLCGAGTHPGGEVSGGPGHNAAHAVLRDLAVRGTEQVQVGATRPD